MEIQVKRIYEPASADDGYRVLVDRLWPRGVSKAKAQLDEWCKQVAPSSDLRTWFGHKPERFDDFTKRYREELDDSDEPQALIERARTIDSDHAPSKLSLLYAAKDPDINHAIVLRDYLRELA